MLSPWDPYGEPDMQAFTLLVSSPRKRGPRERRTLRFTLSWVPAYAGMTLMIFRGCARLYALTFRKAVELCALRLPPTTTKAGGETPTKPRICLRRAPQKRCMALA